MMRRGRWWLVAALLLALPGSAWAIESGVDARLAFYRWVEDLQPIAPTETGPMALVGGWMGGSPLPSHPSVRLRGDVRLLVGYVNYETALLATPTVPRSTESVYLGSTQEASVGWRVQRPEGFLEPFAGLAYRWWLRSIQSNSTVTGYDEWYHTLVARLGVRGELTVGKGSAIYWEFSGDPMLWAKEDIDGVVAGEVLHVENGKRLGWTIDTGLRTRRIEVGVFWQAMRLGESNVLSNGLGQPKSDQDIIGVKVAVPF
jgi:hypothetical protein